MNIDSMQMYELITGAFFYIFAGITLLASLMIVSARNPVHGVLFLILAFFSTAGLFVLIGAEFIAMTLIIVYVGAVAVLFLFVVMMMNVRIERIKAGFNKYLPMIVLLFLVLLGDLCFIIKASLTNVKVGFAAAEKISNTHAIGMVLYTDYFYIFQIAGLILLVAMISSISLTLTNKKNSLKQDRTAQLARNKSNSMKVVKVEFRAGI
jgi:NADH-quinone oxidoreductase subunit J